MEQRRIFLVIALSLLVVIAYQELVVKRFYPPPDAAAPTDTPISPPVGDSGTAPSPVAAAPAAPAATEGAAAPVPALEGRDVVVDTELYRATFTTLGARLKSLELKHYRATVHPDSPPLQLVLFPQPSRLPLALALRGQERQVDDASTVYAVDRDSATLAADESATLTFTGTMPDGARLQKRITMHGHDYLWALDATADGVPPGFTEMAIGWEEGVDPAGAAAAEVVFDHVLVLQDGKLQQTAFTALTAPQLVNGNIGFTAFSGRYFLAALVPLVEPTNSLRVWSRHEPQSVETQVLLPSGTFAAQAELYLGPKDIDRLERVGHGLRKAVDLGWFTFIALPMLQALRFLHAFTGNYGVAIILLTVIIKLLFYPLTKKSFESMRQMQKLQPEMQKLRERLADKPDEMNREIMELYRRHKVNPLGGCLPMLLQIPVFVGLYNALLNAVELRHAPFIGWITDLSAPDRLGSIQLPFVTHPGIPVLTLVMGLSMLLQQWMTPSPADPQQQKVMMIMPVVFTFMFINFPAGLVLYWLVNNCLTIAQQYAMMQRQQA
ncbi:MAG: membrane protein insertase YidC [Deltaproteobacteria bacterium]|nr:membrane protein insertase YidC [Deltaproteobacteria bacterium]